MSAYPDIIPATQNKPISIWDVNALTKALRMSKVKDNISFDSHAAPSDEVKHLVEEFLGKADTLEIALGLPILVFQDGVNNAYNIKCTLLASVAGPLCDINAKLDIGKETLRANRELLKQHPIYLNMVAHAKKGREFNDIVVEYDTSYDPNQPLKVWGGQHRITAIKEGLNEANRYHGFRIYFHLSKKQRSDVALVSNTNMNVTNDTRDRIIEETQFENKLRDWSRSVELLGPKDDFPDSAGKAGDKITVKRARCFVVNFYRANELGSTLRSEQLDLRVYEPMMIKSGGTFVDPKYSEVMEARDILSDAALLAAGKAFSALHRAQIAAFEKSPELRKKKAYRTKALVESMLCGWSFVAGLLQSHPERLANHYQVPKTDKKRDIPDPLNAAEMSSYKHEWDEETYRGIGTRAELKDRQRVAQMFLMKSQKENAILDHDLLDEAVTQVFYFGRKKKRHKK
jgi:hypothetical protein